MAEGGENFEVLKKLVKTGIGECWPKVTHLIAVIKNSDGKVIWGQKYQTSVNHLHAEIQMLNDDKFKGMVKERNVNIILISNYSPCRECADKLIAFYKCAKESVRKFTIRFSQLYRIDEKSNKDGLRDLNRAGITLEAMTEESWFDVLMLFVFDLELADKVRKRDGDTRQTLKTILDKKTGQEADTGADQGIKAITQGTKALGL